jgi:hypothetical protein
VRGSWAQQGENASKGRKNYPLRNKENSRASGNKILQERTLKTAKAEAVRRHKIET